MSDSHDWQDEVDSLTSYLASRCLTREQLAMLLSSYFIVAMRELAATDPASALDILAGLGERLHRDDSRGQAMH